MIKTWSLYKAFSSNLEMPKPNGEKKTKLYMQKIRVESFKYGILKTNSSKVVINTRIWQRKKELISPKQTAII